MMRWNASSWVMFFVPVRTTALTLASSSLLRSPGRVLIFLSRVMNNRFLPSAPISSNISVSLAPSPDYSWMGVWRMGGVDHIHILTR